MYLQGHPEQAHVSPRASSGICEYACGISAARMYHLFRREEFPDPIAGYHKEGIERCELPLQYLWQEEYCTATLMPNMNASMVPRLLNRL